jgi:transcriptional antiterminator RfaH
MNPNNPMNPNNSSNTMNSNKWYVIQTKPKREEEVKSYLSTKGLEMFFPLMEKFVLKNGRVTRGIAPLFPSYLFGKFDLYSSYSLVRWARGVRKILGFGGYPSPVADEVVELIKCRTDENEVLRKVRNFQANDVIRVTFGPMRDLLGIFEKWMSDGERVTILLNLIGYQPTIELHYSMLEKVA